MSVNAATLAKLAKFDTPTIANVIELFEVRPRTAGYMDGRIRAAFPEFPPSVGFAATATFRSAAPPAAGTSYASLGAQVDLMATLDGPTIVVFQDLDEPAVSATFGEVMCSTYKGFGAVGLVTSGAGRDLEQVRGLGFPVFTGSTICSHGYCHTLHIGVAVRVGGLTVHTGELLHADLNGVLQIPLDIADEVADAAEEFARAERHVLDYVTSQAKKTSAELTERIGLMKADLDALRKRCSRQLR